MKRGFVSLVFVLMLALESVAKVYIPLVKSVPPSTGGGGDVRTNVRSSSYAPLAYYENDYLYIQYPASTVSSVIITNDSTDIVVISQNFLDESTSVQVNISTLRRSCAYNISVNAFGNWWVGYFDLNDVTIMTQKIRKGYTGVLDDSEEGRVYTFFGVAGNATSGWNYGVTGILSGENGGTGVYGSSRYDEGFNTGGVSRDFSMVI